MRRKEKTESSRNTGLRSYLLRFLVIFLVVVIFVTWLFQVGLLNILFEKVRKRDMEKAADEIIETIGTKRFNQTVYMLSMDNLLNIQIYRIDGSHALLVSSATHDTDENTVSLVSSESLAKFYSDAKKNDGSHHTLLTFGGQEVKTGFLQKLFPRAYGRSETFVSREMIHMAHIRLFNDALGNEYMIFLNASLEPMAPLVHTLERQFVWIFVILVLFSIAYVIPMSKKIARPLVHMNEAAKQLAIGNYDADFGVDHGYKETKELAETLTFASRELSKTDRMQKELTANISHDLRTPLTMIRGYAEVMRDIPEENTPENLQILIDETERLTELVNDLMDLSKIQSGVHSPVMEFFDLTSAIREVLCRYEAFTKSQGYCITFDAEENVPVFADRGMILQVIYNLINNAIHYTGEDLCVLVKQTVIGGKVRFSVQDTGEGIPEDQLNLIWDRYYKVDKTHRSAKVGTGLGLSIVKGILDVHGANYGVESKLGEGSVFWFELPISAPPQSFDNE